MPKFGELLRRLRGNRSQREVAADLNMPITTLSSLENQVSAPRGPLIKKFADYYGVTPAYFYDSGTSAMKTSEPAREWLASLRQSAAVKDTIATYAPPEYPEEVKKQFADLIRQRKNANT
jgi:transcriptional regulator with XRE-family HTH domain